MKKLGFILLLVSFIPCRYSLLVKKIVIHLQPQTKVQQDKTSSAEKSSTQKSASTETIHLQQAVKSQSPILLLHLVVQLRQIFLLQQQTQPPHSLLSQQIRQQDILIYKLSTHVFGQLLEVILLEIHRVISNYMLFIILQEHLSPLMMQGVQSIRKMWLCSLGNTVTREFQCIQVTMTGQSLVIQFLHIGKCLQIKHLIQRSLEKQLKKSLIMHLQQLFLQEIPMT